MNGIAGHAASSQIPRKVITQTLSISKNQNTICLVNASQDFDKVSTFVLQTLSDDHLLCDIRIHGLGVDTPDLNMNRFPQKILGQISNLSRPGGSKHHCLVPLRDPLDDGANLGLEAHIQHSVGFVQHQKSDSMQSELVVLTEIIQTAGTAHAEVGTATQLTELRATRCSTVNAGSPHPCGPAEAVGFRLNLARQLACGGHHQHRRPPLSQRIPTLGQHFGKRRQHKCKSFPTPCLCNADDVAAHSSDRPAICLNGSRRCKPGAEHSLCGLHWESTLVKGCHRRRNFAAAPHLRFGEVSCVMPVIVLRRVLVLRALVVAVIALPIHLVPTTVPTTMPTTMPATMPATVPAIASPMPMIRVATMAMAPMASTVASVTSIPEILVSVATLVASVLAGVAGLMGGVAAKTVAALRPTKTTASRVLPVSILLVLLATSKSTVGGIIPIETTG
mmetsp:Transcript_81484/g.186484  ORF Transcript_81484/g.186484 Transcript_81484/m.186484 type:complete len:448 (+) Transcript_81484:734-2077(+)